MKKMSHSLYAAILTCAMFGMTGCSAFTADYNTDITEAFSEEETDAVTAETGSQASEESQPDPEKTAAAASLSHTSSAAKIDTTELFSDRDLTQTADTSSAKTITVKDGETCTVSEEGVYVIQGSASDCTIVVNADEQAKIQLVLDGVSITNSDFPAVYVVSADKVFLTSTGSNTLAVTGAFRADGETNTDAVIYSREDLVLNGTGSLTVTSASGNGISGKDDLKVTGGSYTITSAEDAIEANDSIAVCGGTFEIETGKDGLHAENDEGAGDICITGGTFTIQAESDGIQAASVLQIDGGTFTVDSAEGFEATYVQINDGTISINASDDGINASSGSAGGEVAVEINGGDITIVMAQGDTDGIDANGAIYVNGGRIDVTAPMSSFDYDTTAEFNGGTIIINGEEVSEIPADMMGGFGGRGGFGGWNNEDGENGRPTPPQGDWNNEDGENGRPTPPQGDWNNEDGENGRPTPPQGDWNTDGQQGSFSDQSSRDVRTL